MLTVGQIATRLGLRVSAVHFYERRGLLPAVPRVGGQRRYRAEHLRRLAFVQLCQDADLSLDAEEFSGLVKQAGKNDVALLQKAIALYRGDYMPESLYEPWVAEERERLATLFLESADRLTELLMARDQYTEAIDLAQRILARDKCWERAYRHMMLAYDHLGDRGQVGRTFQRCSQALRDELGISPAPETQELYEKLRS